MYRNPYQTGTSTAEKTIDKKQIQGGSMNGKFFTLPEEKQKRIINAAYVVFADSSYQKASMSRIAAAGGISKSLLFHYFQNKKELYLYLWENINRISCEIELKYYKETTDFFEIMTRKILARCEFMRTAPDEYLFSIRALFAEPLEIREATGKSYKEVYEDAAGELLGFVDLSVFRPGIDVGMLLEEIDSYLFHSLWQMLSAGKLDPDGLERDFLKRVGQWRIAYLK